MIGMPGWMELLLLLALGGGAGIPLGVPPQPEDPLMALIPAEECVFYTAWSGVAKPDAAGGNRTEALLAEKEIQHALVELEKVATRGFQRAAEDGGVEAIMLGELFPQLGKLLLTRPACLYVTKFEIKAGASEVQAGMVVRVDDQAGGIGRIMEKLEAEIVGPTAETIEIEGSTYHRFQIGKDGPRVTWGIRGKYLIVCLGENAVAEMFDSVRSGQPGWLKDLRAGSPVERVSTISYADLDRVFALVEVGGFAPLAAMIEAGGLNRLTTYSSVTGLDKTGFVHRTSLGIDGERKGFLSLLDVNPLVKEDLVRIPSDTPAAIALRLNPDQTYSSFVEMIGQMNGLSATDTEQQIDRGAGSFGIKVREQVIASLGENAYIYAAPHDGDLISGWTGVVQIRDYMTLFQVHEKLVAMFQEKLQSDRDRGVRRVPKIGSVMANHHKVYFLSIPDDVPFSPSWCLTRDGLVFGLFPQAVKAHVLRDAASESLVNQSDLTKYLKEGADGPIAFAYFDSKRVVEILYPLAQIGMQALANQLRREEFDLDVSLLPSVASITKNLQPRVNVVRRTATGIEIEGHQTLPGGSLGSSAPLIAAGMIPAMIGAQENARRTHARGQMRQISLALHNFHDVLGAFPAAYSVDKDGKPLLSWRVHILPYIEHQPLYDRFHLDEPWDSEHNKKLIAEMPHAFRSPASLAKPGYTNYLAVRGENAVFVKPDAEQKGKDVALGKRLADIEDGASNTVMIVEANDRSAVPWTKPDDFDAGQKEPLAGLAGLHGRGFHAGLADGSVRFIYDQVSTDTLQLLFDRRDGKPIPPDHTENGTHLGVHKIEDVHDHEHVHEHAVEATDSDTPQDESGEEARSVEKEPDR